MYEGAFSAQPFPDILKYKPPVNTLFLIEGKRQMIVSKQYLNDLRKYSY